LRPGDAGRKDLLMDLRNTVIKTNLEWADRFKINPSAAATVVKPNGNFGVLSATGNSITGWYSRYIKRHVRVNALDPMASFLIDAGVPHWPEVGDDPKNPRVWVFAFPLAAPQDTLFKDDLTAIQQLENWKMFKLHWTEHNPSVTIYIEKHEWVAVGHWILQNWEYVGGLAFLPKDNGIYQLAPNVPLTKEQYDEFVQGFPAIQWEKFPRYEKSDSTTLAHDLACSAGVCELV
jgi:ribonucleoside-triphosphate reductase (thioredoxin)